MKNNQRVVVTVGLVVTLLSTSVLAQMGNSHAGFMPMGQMMGQGMGQGMGMSGANLSDENLDMLAEHMSIMHVQMDKISAEKM